MNNETAKLACPLCGGETDKGIISCIFRNGKDIYFVTFTCSKCDSQFTIYDDYESALKRFSTRPESAWEMYRRLHIEYGSDFIIAARKKLQNYTETLIVVFNNYDEQEVFSMLQQIEKELKE